MNNTNYKKISTIYFEYFKIILNIVYGINSNYKVIIDEKGLVTITKPFNIFTYLFYKKKAVIKKHIYNILLEDFPRVYSLISSGHYGFSFESKEDIEMFIAKYNNNEISKIEEIISYYYNKLKKLPIVDYWNDLKKIDLQDDIIISVSEDTNIPTQNIEEEEEEGLIYVLDTFMWSARKKKFKKNIIAYSLSLKLMVSPLSSSFLNLVNKFKNNKIIEGYYFSKSPPFRKRPDLEMCYYNSG